MEESEKGFDLSSFYAALAATVKGRGITPEPLGAISTLLRGDPNLNPDAAHALEAMLHAAYDNLKSKPRKKI